MRERTRERLRRLPFPPLRDLVDKHPSTGANLDVLDGVRGLAVVLVIASHSGAFGLDDHGAVGVWLFFALSAFLLTMPFTRHPERLGDPRWLGRYVARRLRRILPPYFLLLAVWWVFVGGASDTILRHALFLEGNLHLWSIPQEMLFYLLLPFLAALYPLVFRRNALAAALGFAALAALASFGLTVGRFSLTTNGHPQRFFLAVFLCGMAASYAAQAPVLIEIARRPAARRILNGVGFVLLALLVLTARSYHEVAAQWIPVLRQLSPPLGWVHPGAFGAIAGALIFIAVVCTGSAIQRTMSALPLRALGLVSYSAYLLHVPIGFTLASLVPRGLGRFAIVLAASYGLACLSYTFIERPFLVIRSKDSG
ncbi:MAG: acyltransferase [Proteobacteria bacterium]|nr:acyltransferase [Pseudomonadota bacterium]